MNYEEVCQCREHTPSTFSLPQENQTTHCYCFNCNTNFDLHHHKETANERNSGCQPGGEYLICTLCEDDKTLSKSAIENEKPVKQNGRSYVPLTGFVESHTPGGTLASILEQGSNQPKVCKASYITFVRAFVKVWNKGNHVAFSMQIMWQVYAVNYAINFIIYFVFDIVFTNIFKV